MVHVNSGYTNPQSWGVVVISIGYRLFQLGSDGALLDI